MPVIDEEKECLNCKRSEGMKYPFLCIDCWRMAILTALMGGSSTELIRKTVERFLGQ